MATSSYAPSAPTRGPWPAPRLLWLIAATLLAAGVAQAWALAAAQPPGVDFLPLWTAGRMAAHAPDRVYDFAAVTRAQTWLLPHIAWSRPYAYPPTALLILAPLGRLPFFVALALWWLAGVGLFVAAGARLAGRDPLLAAILTVGSPAVAIAVDAGQTVLMAGALLALAVAELGRRPRLAGALLGLAAALKPQVAILAPVALLGVGAIQALASAAAVLAAACAASAMAFGWARWGEWVASLPAFGRIVEATPSLGSAVITPAWAARMLGLSGPVGVIWIAGFALGGAWLVWRVFRSHACAAARAGVLAAASLMATPYAMSYDGALLAPAAAGLAIGGFAAARPLAPLLALGAAFAIVAPHLGLAAVASFAALAAYFGISNGETAGGAPSGRERPVAA